MRAVLLPAPPAAMSSTSLAQRPSSTPLKRSANGANAFRQPSAAARTPCSAARRLALARSTMSSEGCTRHACRNGCLGSALGRTSSSMEGKFLSASVMSSTHFSSARTTSGTPGVSWNAAVPSAPSAHAGPLTSTLTTSAGCPRSLLWRKNSTRSSTDAPTISRSCRDMSTLAERSDTSSAAPNSRSSRASSAGVRPAALVLAVPKRLKCSASL